MTKDELIAEIKQAFSSQPYPGDMMLVYDNSGDHLECEEVREAFKGKTWDSLSQNFLFEQRYSFYFFTHESANYYLPAFLIFVINDFRNADDLSDNLVSALTLPSEIDVVVVANAVKKYKIDQQMPNIDFDEILRNQLQYKNQDIHNFIARVTQLTREQGRAVRHYLDFMKQEFAGEFSDGELDKAIERYWFIFD